MEEDNIVLIFLLKAICVIGVGVAIIVSGYYLISPAWNHMEAKSNEHSYVFIQSKKELLLKLNLDYKKLDVQIAQAEVDGQQQFVKNYKSQQMAIIDRMKLESASLPASEVPIEIVNLIK